MKPLLSSLRRCFEGAVPAVIATCDENAIPNVAYLSQVHYIDEEHVALSFQFFNTTRKNILANPTATILLVDPVTAEHYHLHISYLHTVSEGPLFESMKARLAGIASHSGMSDVFRLKGSDVYRVQRIEPVSGTSPACWAPVASSPLPVLRRTIERLGGCQDLSSLLADALACLAQEFNIQHAMVLMLDAAGDKLYTVASHGYLHSGAGSEIGLGEGIIGVAAREGVAIRIGHCATEYLYSYAVRESYLQNNASADLEMRIPVPGLARSGSQIAVPILQGQQLIAVLYAESPEEMRFSWDDEDALVALSHYLALAIRSLERCSDLAVEPPTRQPVSKAGSKPVDVCFYRTDQSVFINNEYLIKGVAGAILWKLVRDHSALGRDEFSNRELRRDNSLQLPDVVDNLEARLILLQRRLAERCNVLAIEKIGRGRFRLRVAGPLKLREAAG
ncbi:GAF domain-containing protein [Marinobacter daqiaonensis]|uniref:GAF domain-containing protein n=1 Tax=Marinobacter daqiaonensis TaxID=650891 RepID=A0A1I6GRQ7_9GAMM|nr:GAF domain-containing protein [Marinobacter daqiaonensis]SFR44816.1 GAF domain-containing protein [Marinobacter daqiaonensis]